MCPMLPKKKVRRAENLHVLEIPHSYDVVTATRALLKEMQTDMRAARQQNPANFKQPKINIQKTYLFDLKQTHNSP